MIRIFVFLLLTYTFLITACQPRKNKNEVLDSRREENHDLAVQNPTSTEPPVEKNAEESEPAVRSITAADIMARPEVPILCYHQIRDWRPRDSKRAKDYIVPVATFRAQLKMLADSGYQTVLPDQLLAYLNTGAPLPPKPIMLTFDDTDLDQYTVALPEMNKYGFKGVFFIMTVSLGRPRYMSRAQVKELAAAGHIIGAHTWDHQNVKKLKGQDWVTQVEKPSKVLEAITGQPIQYFAYPFGLWSPEVIPELKKRNFKAAFQLSTRRYPEEPLYTIRRMIASGYWAPRTLHRNMVLTFD